MQVQCKVAFEFEGRSIEVGDLAEDTDPEVRGNEHLFQCPGGGQVVVAPDAGKGATARSGSPVAEDVGSLASGVSKGRKPK